MNLFAVAKVPPRFGRDGKRWYVTETEELNPQEFALFEAVKAAPLGELDHDDELMIHLNNHNPDVNILHYGQSPLFFACNTGKFGVVKVLLRWPHPKPIDINLCSDAMETPFLAACRGGYLDIVKALLEVADATINPNQKASDGRSALWEASKNGHVKVLKYFLDELPMEFIDWETTTPGISERGTTCIDIARIRGHLAVIPILETGRRRAREKRARDRLRRSAAGAKVVVRLRDADGVFFAPHGGAVRGEMGRETRNLGDEAGIDFGKTRANYDKLIRRVPPS